MSPPLPDVPPPFWTVPGHAAGEFLGASEWVLLEETTGRMRVEVSLPAHVRNPRGELFGGFVPTYVDMVALATVYAGSTEPRAWLATAAMHIDYLAPLDAERFVIDAELVVVRDRTRVVQVRLLDLDDRPCAVAMVTMRVASDEGPPATPS